jgi:hypothetical protein
MRLCEIFKQNLGENYTKNFYKKLCIDPDCRFEWSDLFGYAEQDEDNEHDEDIEEQLAKKKKKKEDAERKRVKETTTGGGGGGKTNSKTVAKKPVTDEGELQLGEVQIFMASFKFRVGDASGDKARRDIIQSIQYAPDIDSFIVVAQKGAVSIWNNKLKLSGCTFLKVIFFNCIFETRIRQYLIYVLLIKEQSDGWLNGCCFLPNIKRVVITAERSITFWDYRSTKKSSSNTQMVEF